MGVLEGSGVVEVGHISNQPNKHYQCGAITADVRTSNNLPNFPSGNL